MPTVGECWRKYVEDHLTKTVNPQANGRYWGRLQWFEHLDPEASSFPKEVERYLGGRSGVGAATINRELALLRASLRHAERTQLIAKAPFLEALPKPPPRMRALTRKEAGRMVAAADARGNWRERVYIRLALGTAARPAAIMDLTWAQVEKVIDFRKFTPKSHRMKKRTIVPMNEMVEFALRLANRHRHGDYVLNWHGRKVSHPRDMIKRIAKEAGIDDVSPHVLRHTVASILLQEGEDLLKVSQLLGHASVVITQQVYFQHPPAWLKETTTRLKF